MKNKSIIILSLLVCSVAGITLYFSVFHDKKEISDNNKKTDDSLTKNIDDSINEDNTDILKDDKGKKEQIISKKLEKENNSTGSDTNTPTTEQQDNNYVHINNQHNNSIENDGQNNYSQDNNNQNANPNNNSVGNSSDNSSNDSNNQTIKVPIDLNDEVVDNNPNDDIYPTVEACNAAALEIAFKDTTDIINVYCFSVAENGKLLGYRTDINCLSGNCDKYK